MHFHEGFKRPGLRAARLSIAATSASPLIRYSPPAKLCVASRSRPVTYGPRNPPSAPIIVIIATPPAAAVPPIMRVVSAQNGPIVLHNPIATSDIAHNATEIVCARAAHANPTAASAIQPARCPRLSFVRSELHPTATVQIAASRYGTVAYRAIKLASPPPRARP